MRLQGRVAIVTGAANGIGRATAIRLGREGARLVLNDVQAEALAPIAGEAAAPGQVRAVIGDVSKEATAEAIAREAVSAFGRIDVLVNNAGISGLGEPKPFLSTPLEEWNAVLGVNLLGPFLMATACAPGMIERRDGVIINVASVGAVTTLKGRGPYCVSKAGLVQMTKALASEYAGQGLRVNAIGPGWMDTPFIRWRLEDPELAAPMLAKIPAGRVVMPDEIAEMILFLASPGAAYVNGALLVADGAMSTTLG